MSTTKDGWIPDPVKKLAWILGSLVMPVAAAITKIIRTEDPLFFIISVVLSGAIFGFLIIRFLLLGDSTSGASGVWRKALGVISLILILGATVWLVVMEYGDSGLTVTNLRAPSMETMASSSDDEAALFSVNWVVRSKRMEDILLDTATVEVKHASFLESCEPGAIYPGPAWPVGLNPCSEESYSQSLDTQRITGSEIESGDGREYWMHPVNDPTMCPEPIPIPRSVTFGIYQVFVVMEYMDVAKPVITDSLWIVVPEARLGTPSSNEETLLDSWLQSTGLSPVSEFDPSNGCHCRNATRMAAYADEIDGATDDQATDLARGIANRVLELRRLFPELFAEDSGC